MGRTSARQPSADIAESRPLSLCSAGALEEFLAASARPTSFRQYCELLLLLGRDYTAARRGPQWWQPSGRGTTSEHARPSCPMFRTLIRRWRRASKGGWDGMCTRGHVISKSEWIGVPARRRAHLLPPSRAPPSLLVGWLACWLLGLHTAANLHFQSWLISDGRKGEAGGRRNRSLAPQEAMRACEQHGRPTYLLRA